MSDVRSGVGLGQGYWALDTNHKRKFLTQVFGRNWAEIPVFWAFDWLSSISGSIRLV